MSNRITRFYIDKFKSLSDFELPIPQSEENNFICLIGKNGAGKSTILQALDFTGQIFRGNISSWLKTRGWKRTDLLEKTTFRTIKFEIEGVFGGKVLTWNGTFNTTTMNCTTENIFFEEKKFFQKSEKQIIFYNSDKNEYDSYTQIMDYEGSILASINKNDVKKYNLHEFVYFMENIFSFDTLNSKQLRSFSRKSDNCSNIGSGGEKIASMFYKLQNQTKHDIINTIIEFYPWLHFIHPRIKKGGWIELHFLEKDIEETKKLSKLFSKDNSFGVYRGINAQHTCDGLLRLFAIVTELVTSDSFIVFDEIENGFHPEIMKKLIQLFIKSKKQILITTHNPVLLNYIEDDIAKESVVLVYKAEPFKSKAIRFFDIPEAEERLQYLGAGEAFLDVNFDTLVDNIPSAEQDKL